MANSVYKQHKLDIGIGTKLEKQQLDDVSKHIRRMAGEWQDVLDDAIKHGIEDGARSASIKDVLTQFNAQLKAAKLEPLAITVDELEIMDKPIEHAAKLVIQKLGNAFKGGGLGNIISSEITDSLNSMGENIEKIYDRIEQGAKKSANNIEKYMLRIQTAASKISKEQMKGADKALSRGISIPQDQKSAQNKFQGIYTSSRSQKDKTSIDAQIADVAFVRSYDRLAEKGKLSEVFGDQLSEVTEYYNKLAKIHQTKMNYLNDILVQNEYTGGTKTKPTQYNQFKGGEPWAREKTLQEIKSILSGGLTVKDGGSGGEGDNLNTSKLENDLNQTIQARVDAENRAKDAAEKIAAIQEKMQKQGFAIYRGINEEDATESRQDGQYEYGAEYWAKDKKTALSYAVGSEDDTHTQLLQTIVSPKKPLVLDMEGHEYGEIKNIPALINTLKDVGLDIRSLWAKTADVSPDEIQQTINKFAKDHGYDSVITNNVKDANLEGAPITSTVAVLDDSILSTIRAFDVVEGVLQETATKIAEWYHAPDQSKVAKVDGAANAELEAELARLRQEQETASKEIDKYTKKEEKQKKELEKIKSKFPNVDPSEEQKSEAHNPVIIEQEADAHKKVASAIREENEELKENISLQVQSNKLEDNSVRNKDRYGYHYGNLLSGNGTARDTFGQTLDNLSIEAEPGSPSSYGYGIFGGGLFYVNDPNLFGDEAPSTGSKFINKIDLSKYNLYLADTEERVIALASVLSNLQRFAVKQAVPNYTVFDEQLSGVSVDTMWQQMQNVFTGMSMTREEFNSFIQEMVLLLKQSGAYFDKESGMLNFSSIDTSIDNSDNISARLMKKLGYQGVDTAGTSFNGMAQGSVLFDFQKEDIIGFFDKVDTAILDYNNSLNQTDISNMTNLLDVLKEIDSISERIETHKNIMLDATGGKYNTQSMDQTLQALEHRKIGIQQLINQSNLNSAVAIKDTPKQTSQQGVGVNSEALVNLNATLTNLTTALNKESANVTAAIDATELSAVLHDGKPYVVDIQGKSVESDNNNKIGVNTEGLSNILTAITFKVQDVTERESACNSIDQESINSLVGAIKTAITPQSDNTNADSADKHYALEATLQSVQNILQQIQINTAKIESVEIVPASTEVGNVLATENTLGAIKTSVEAINKKVVQGAKTKTSNGGGNKTSGGKKNAESYAGSQYFPEKIKTQTMHLAKFRAQLMTTGKLTDDIDAQIYELLDGLKKVQNGPDLSRWNQQFLQLKTSVGIEDIFEKAEDKVTTASYEELIDLQKTRNQLELQYEKAKEGTATKQFYAEQITQLDSVIAKQEELLQNEEYEAKLVKMRIEQERKLGAEKAKASDKDAAKALKEEVKQLRKQNNIDIANNRYNAGRRAMDDLWKLDATIDPNTIPEVVKLRAALNSLGDQYNAVNQAMRNGDAVSDEEIAKLNNSSGAVAKKTAKLKEMLAHYEKFKNGENIGTYVHGVNEEAQMTNAINQQFGGKAKVKAFERDTSGFLTARVEVKEGARAFTEYKVAVEGADRSIRALKGNTKQLPSFLDSVKRKLGEISQYVSAMSVISRAGQELRKGIQYVRDIDLALTELKKVTDETEESYDKFLDTASKTAAKVGSTIKDVISSTADWARLNI